jgi:signal transduction histidine kinase
MGQAAEWESVVEPAGESLQSLAAVVPEGVAIVRGGRIAWANNRLVEMTGLRSPSALVGAALVELLADTGNGLPDPCGQRAVECALRRPDGETRIVICRPAWPESGPDPGLWVIEDATHVRLLEREILRMSQDLHRANREAASLREQLRAERAEREELLTVVSHELRTPVTVIGGYNRLLLAEEVGPLTEGQRGFLQESAKSCQRLDAFIGNLLEASRATRGDEVLEVCNASLARTIDDVVKLLRPLLDQRQLRLQVAVAPGADHARFDRLRLEQILTNLLGNAVKFSEPGGTIEIATHGLRRRARRGTGGPRADLRPLRAGGRGEPGRGAGARARHLQAPGRGARRGHRRRRAAGRWKPFLLHVAGLRRRGSTRRRGRGDLGDGGEAQGDARAAVQRGAREPAPALPRVGRGRRRGHPHLSREPARTQGLRRRHRRGRAPGAGAP